MSTTWKITQHAKKLPVLKNPLFIEGLPGIGSVTKIALDFIVADTEATKLLSFSSSAFPPSVFVNSDNLVDLPSINLYHKKTASRDFLFLSGDLQPVTEVGCYTFAQAVLDQLEKFGVERIITLGGVALNSVPKNPQIYCTGNDARFVKEFTKNTTVNASPFGIIGPIVGISGLLLGLAKERGIPAITLLVETYSHPMYMGVDGSRVLLKLLSEKLNISLDMHTFESDIEQLQQGNDAEKLKRNTPARGTFTTKINYIG